MRMRRSFAPSRPFLAAAAIAACAGLCSCQVEQEIDPARMPPLLIKARQTEVPWPTKVIGMMHNYPPLEGSPASPPAFFVRAASALSPHGADLEIPQDFSSVLYEGELVIVIGKRARRVTEEEAASCILGYTCGMDGSPLALGADGQRDVARSIAGKSADGVAPVGPWVVEGIDYRNQEIELRVDDEPIEKASAADLIWGPARIVAEVSRTITLEPGDLIFTGARRAIPEFKPGAHVEVEITDVGILSNFIAGEPEPPAADH